MFDGRLRRFAAPTLVLLARRLARAGVRADHLTVTALILGLICAFCIGSGLTSLALVPLLASRLCDGLDGAVARLTQTTDRGGFNDIVFDFIFYGAVPLAFAVLSPTANALAAATLLFSFYANGASFLAFAALAAKRGLESEIRGKKSLYFTAGLAEATETIMVFILMCVLPEKFALLAYAFSIVCLITAADRIALAWRVLR
jgi:phosphatidylglycerophosphate synthase